MKKHTVLSQWRNLVEQLRRDWTQPGWERFRQILEGYILNRDKHFLTRAIQAIGREAHWKAFEEYLERGKWDYDGLEWFLNRLAGERPEAEIEGYLVAALDATLVLRGSRRVWGTCTYHDYSSRSPNRAATVIAHNIVELGVLLADPSRTGEVFEYAPTMQRFYFRRSQLPTGETFHTKHELAVAEVRDWANAMPKGAKLLCVEDGGFAQKNFLRPLLTPPPGQRRVEFLTRCRCDADLYDLPAARPAGKRGRKPLWGAKLPAPQDASDWRAPWRRGKAWVYGQRRRVTYKELTCLWRVTGSEHPVRVIVARVKGYEGLWHLATSAMDLDALKLISLHTARFRQENSFRDRKQELGMGEAIAWTKNPIVRAYQLQMVAHTTMTLLQLDLNRTGEWYQIPPWYRHKTHSSFRDVESVLRTELVNFGQLTGTA